jgi:hypothetical protein
MLRTTYWIVCRAICQASAAVTGRGLPALPAGSRLNEGSGYNADREPEPLFLLGV